MSNRPARLPPLTALRAFDAAARHMSFAKAADELAVTPAALSYQIKSLEEDLDVQLFRRLNRAVELTEAGKALAPGLATGFAAFRQALGDLDRTRANRPLVITAAPAFTAKWLAPRLYQFVARRPDAEVRLVASLRIMDFEADQIDAAIRFSLKATPGLYSEVLIVDRMTPMCAPKIAASLETPEDLRKATLIHDDSMAKLPVRPVWSDWFEAAGVDGPPMDRGPRFSGADHALSAAAKGLGVVLGRTSLAGEDLRSGRLVAPFDLAIDPTAHYRFVCPEGAETRDDVAALLDWLRSVLAEGKDPLPGLRVVTPARLAAAAQ